MISLSIDTLGSAPAKARDSRASTSGKGDFAALVDGMGSRADRSDAGARLPDDRQKLAVERKNGGSAPADVIAADAAGAATPAATEAAPVDAAPETPTTPPDPLALLSDADDKAATPDTASALGSRAATTAPATETTEQMTEPTPAVGTCMVIVTPRFRPVTTPIATDPAPGDDQPAGTCEVDVPMLPVADDGDTRGDQESGDDRAGDVVIINLPPVVVAPPVVADPIAAPAPVMAGDQQVQTIATILAAKAGSQKQAQPADGGNGGNGDQADPNALAASAAKPVVVLPVQPQTTPDAATLQAMAALIRAATDEASDTGAKIADDKTPVGTVQAVSTPVTTPRVEAPAAAAPAPMVDTRRAEWMEALIDRIDEQRGHSGRSLHIALSPDALGGVEVRMRQEGDRIHVAFSTDTAQARSLLADAAPRLAQLADARGIKLGDTGVEQNAQDRRHAAPEQNQLPDAPASALTTESEDMADALSDRIA